MLQLVQYLKGYVCIRVWGYSPERFMNLCSNHDIFLWDIRNHGDYYTMCITVDGFRRIKSIVRKTGTKVAIQKRCGLPFFVPRLRRRKIFLLGLAGSLIFWIWMSTFIWAVDLNGNYTISNDIFMDFLEENGVGAGMKRSALDIEALEARIRQDFDIVTWTSARIDGTRLIIQIRENEVDGSTKEEEKKILNEYGSDLVADHDGIIVSMVTRKGVPQTTVQAEVKKGDILVSGRVPVYNEDATVKKYQYYDADADIFLSRSLHKKEELPLVYEEKVYTGENKKEYFAELFDKEFVFRLGKIKYEDFDKVTDKKQVRLLDNFYLPVFYGSSDNREYVVQKNTYTEKEVKDLFSEKLSKFVASLEEKGVQIIRKNVTINKINKKWQMNVDFQIVERTGENIPVVPEMADIPAQEGTEAATEQQTDTVQ